MNLIVTSKVGDYSLWWLNMMQGPCIALGQIFINNHNNNYYNNTWELKDRIWVYPWTCCLDKLENVNAKVTQYNTSPSPISRSHPEGARERVWYNCIKLALYGMHRMQHVVWLARQHTLFGHTKMINRFHSVVSHDNRMWTTWWKSDLCDRIQTVLVYQTLFIFEDGVWGRDYTNPYVYCELGLTCEQN